MNAEASKLIDALGGTSDVARMFRISKPSVCKWRLVGIPEARMMYLQIAKPKLMRTVNIAAATATSKHFAPDPLTAEV